MLIDITIAPKIGEEIAAASANSKAHPIPHDTYLHMNAHHGGLACGPRQRHCLQGTAFVARPPVASMCCTRVSDPNSNISVGLGQELFTLLQSRDCVKLAAMRLITTIKS